ncbi:MAG: sigma-70 family RNA polymerase sigma factor [Deltaproteobacteria bacterium]|nr:sigma-70 family RNA polymerase sigma factor [Deltaproteobacteria bacterium]
MAPAQATQRLVDDVRRFVRRRVDDRTAREDLVQEILLRVHGRRDQLRDDERLAGWVRRIASNVVTDHYRRRRRAEVLSPTLDEPNPIEPAPAPEPEPERALIGAWLIKTVAELPAPHRDILTLTELQGLTQRESAARLGLTLSAAKSRVLRARAMLLDKLQQCCHLELDHRGALIGYTPRAGGCAPSCCDGTS